jgi:hypothetical protein
MCIVCTDAASNGWGEAVVAAVNSARELVRHTV